MSLIITNIVEHLPNFIYIGPGLGGGIISVVIGVLASFLIALIAIVWYPFKMLLKKFKKPKSQKNGG